MNKNQDMLENAPYRKMILHLCVPTIVIMLVTVVYNMADTFFIGQAGDADKITAISLCSPIFSILSGLGTLFGSGGCTAISLALGKKDTKNVKAITSLCCYGSLLIGVLFFIVVNLALRPISTALGADDSTLEFTCDYLRIIAFGGPVILFSNVFANIVRADGAAKESMIGNLAGTVSNIALDALFILVFSWGIAGAALATVIGNMISTAYFLHYIIKKQPAFSLNPRHVSLKKEIILPVITLGLPLACSTLLMSFSHMIANRMLVSYGSVPMAAQSVAGKVGMLTSMLAMGICMGMQPAISYNCGSENSRRMYSVVKNTGILTVVVGSLVTVACFFARDTIIAAFIDDAQVLAYGQVFIYASLIPGPVYGLYQLCQTFLQSTGKASYATLVALMDKGLFYLPLLFLMRHFWGMYGVVFSSTATLFFSLGAGAFLCIRWNRRMNCISLLI